VKNSKKYLELVIFKGDLSQDGAVFRMNQMKILMRAAAELRGLQYQEDQGSYALFGPSEKMHEGEDAVALFRKKVLTKVDLCGFFSEPELDTKVQVVIKLAEENNLTCGIDLISVLSTDLLMQSLYSLKEWTV
jgi:hypothetical protein